MNSLFERLRNRAAGIRQELGNRVGAARRTIQRSGIRGVPRAARIMVTGQTSS